MVELEFVPKSRAPRPEASLNHDDWVSACRSAAATLILNHFYLSYWLGSVPATILITPSRLGGRGGGMAFVVGSPSIPLSKALVY